MATLPEIEVLRHKFLEKLYDLSEADIHKEVSIEQIETEAHIPPKLTTEIILYLSQKRLIELRTKNICITTGGIYEIEREKQKPAPPTQITNIHGSNYGAIQQGGKGNAQSIPTSPQKAKQEESASKADEKSANKLYDQVIDMSKDWNSIDEVTAQLIIEYSNDAIATFGKTNQDKKVELRRIIEKAEHVLSPDSIDTFKKRAEKTILRFIYPKNRKLRNALLIILGITILISLILPLILGVWNLKGAKEEIPPSTKTPPATKDKIVLIIADTTNSLPLDESHKVEQLTADILDSLPLNTKYAVYPIQNDPQRVSPIISETVTADLWEKEDYRKARRENIATSMGIQRELSPNGNNSCIVEMLWFAQEQLARMADSSTINPDKYDYELIFISDMIETCDSSPAIESTLPPDLSRLAKKSKISSNPNLTNVRITVIYPLTYGPRNRRYSNNAVKEWWRTIFRQCGIKDEWFWDQVHIDWISNGELPRRFKRTI